MKGSGGKGRIILLTGISGSGKTTLGKLICRVLKKSGRKGVEFIDGDTARSFLETGPSYTSGKRFLVTKQIAFAAHLLAENGVDVIVANIAGKKTTRDYLGRKWKRYTQVFMDADINDCIRHDSKGVYRKALKSGRPLCYGIDIPYEKPGKPDVIVYPYKENVKESLDRVVAYLRKTGLDITS